MRLIATMCCKNEEHIAGLSARVALMWNDAIVVLLHDCTDHSEQIIREIAIESGNERVVILKAGGQWTEMQHRMMMLEAAREAGATHISIVDFDEVLTGNLLGLGNSSETAHHVRSFVPHISSGAILQLPLYNLRGSLTRYHQNGIWGQRWGSLAFADAEYLGWSGDRFHQREPTGRPLVSYRPIHQGDGGILHLWGCSERRITAKHALYKVNERLRWPNKPVTEIDRMYNLWRSPYDSFVEYPQQTDWAKPWTFADVPASWLEPYASLMQYLDVDAEPWQEAEVRRLVAEHGKDRFAGLDLFGIA